MLIGTSNRKFANEARSSTNSFYRPELDVLRFSAFFLVFWFHLLPDRPSRYSLVHSTVLKDIFSCIAASMGFGVCLFFILSAFLITTLLLRERRATSTVNLPAFYRRRILRIWPLYFIALALAFVVCGFDTGFPGYGVIAAYLLMSGNLLSQLHLSANIQPLKIYHLWSISVEEQFYLIFPIIARAISIKLLSMLSGALAMLAILMLIHLTHENSSKEEIWQNSLVQFLMFAAGIGLAIFFTERQLPQFTTVLRAQITLLGIVFCFSAQYFCRIGGEKVHLDALHAVIGYMLAMFGCSAFLLAALGFSGRLPQPLIYLGKISYGLYVFHVWCISMAAFLISSYFHISMAEGTASLWMVTVKDLLAFALTVAAASISYRFIEKPFLRLKDKFEIVKTRPA
jgi:peptidoglycan/LPS O-acetylase OafA/YrhL